MNSYILISLWDPEDHATPLSHAFAKKLHNKRNATRFLEGPSPTHDSVRDVLMVCPNLPVVIFGHGGSGLTARSGSTPWATPQQLASMMTGRRVYAFACRTFYPRAALFMSTFASLAVAACIQVFVGHETPVMTPYTQVTTARDMMDLVINKMIEAFIDGEDDCNALRDIGRLEVNWDMPIEIDMPSESPETTGDLNGWSSSAFLGVFFNNLCVEQKDGP